jgi:hypothetical protein
VSGLELGISGISVGLAEMEPQVIQALLSTAALVLLVMSQRAMQLLPAAQESDRIVEIELPGGLSIACTSYRFLKAQGFAAPSTFTSDSFLVNFSSLVIRMQCS